MLTKRKRVLIVEDDPITAKDIKKILEALNYKVINIINTGERAVEEALSSKPDIILMDIFLDGETDGITSAEKIRENLKVPIVYITGIDDEKTFKRAVITEPYGYIVKPFRKIDLESTIQLAIYKHIKELELIKSLEDKQKSNPPKKSYSKRQKEIIETSLKIISEKGIQNLTIKNIAKEIKVSLPAIYKHFKSKTEIMKTLIKGYIKEYDSIIDNVKNLDDKPIESIKTWFFQFINTFQDNPEYITIFTSKEIFKGEDSLIESVNRVYKKHKKSLIEFIVDGQRVGSVNKKHNPMHIAIFIIGAIKSVVDDWKTADYSFDIKEESDRLWKSILKILA